jgi:hypothetical protein
LAPLLFPSFFSPVRSSRPSDHGDDGKVLHWKAGEGKCRYLMGEGGLMKLKPSRYGGAPPTPRRHTSRHPSRHPDGLRS